MWHGRYSQWQRPLVTQRTQLNFYFYFCETLFSSALTNLTKIYVKVICTVGLYVYFIQRSKLLKHIYSLPHTYIHKLGTICSRRESRGRHSLGLPGPWESWPTAGGVRGLPRGSLGSQSSPPGPSGTPWASAPPQALARCPRAPPQGACGGWGRGWLILRGRAHAPIPCSLGPGERNDFPLAPSDCY